MNQKPNRWRVVYREKNSTIWWQSGEIGTLRSEFNNRHGVTIFLDCLAFGSLRAGEFFGEIVIIEQSSFSCDVRYAQNAAIAYRSGKGSETSMRVEAQILPPETQLEIPVQYKNFVRSDNGFLHFTTKIGQLNDFLGFISQDKLTIENDQIVGAEAATVPTESTVQLGRVVSSPSKPQAANAKRGLFERIFKRF